MWVDERVLLVVKLWILLWPGFTLSTEYFFCLLRNALSALGIGFGSTSDDNVEGKIDGIRSEFTLRTSVWNGLVNEISFMQLWILLCWDSTLFGGSGESWGSSWQTAISNSISGVSDRSYATIASTSRTFSYGFIASIWLGSGVEPAVFNVSADIGDNPNAVSKFFLSWSFYGVTLSPMSSLSRLWNVG